MANQRVALLSFDALITNYHEVHVWFMDFLRRKGYQTTFISCNRAFRRCTNINSNPTVISPRHIDQFKNDACEKCIEKQNQVSASSKYCVDLGRDGLNSEQKDLLESMMIILQKDRKINAIFFSHKEYFGLIKFAFYDFGMSQKVSPATILNDEQIEIFGEFVSDLIVLQNFSRRLSKSERLETVIYTNGNYGFNSTFREVLGPALKYVTIEHTFSVQTFWNRIFFEPSRLRLVQKWGAIVRSLNTKKSSFVDLVRALDVFWNRYLGNDFNSYTGFQKEEARNLEFMKLRKKHSRVYSIFLSSSDELNSHVYAHNFVSDTMFYNSQNDFLKDLPNYISSEVAYIIRIHPRLAPNKRDKMSSREVDEMIPLLEKLKEFPNVMIVYPEEKLSSYFVLINSTLVFVAWSTMGLESLVAGVPTIALFPKNCMYPIDDLCFQPKDLGMLRLILEGKMNLDDAMINLPSVLRWISHVYRTSSIPVPSPRRPSTNRLYIWLERIFVKSMSKSLAREIIYRVYNVFIGKKILRALSELSDEDSRLVFQEKQSVGRLESAYYRYWIGQLKRRFQL